MDTIQTAGKAEASRDILEKQHALLDMSANSTWGKDGYREVCNGDPSCGWKSGC